MAVGAAMACSDFRLDRRGELFVVLRLPSAACHFVCECFEYLFDIIRAKSTGPVNDVLMYVCSITDGRIYSFVVLL